MGRLWRLSIQRLCDERKRVPGSSAFQLTSLAAGAALKVARPAYSLGVSSPFVIDLPGELYCNTIGQRCKESKNKIGYRMTENLSYKTKMFRVRKLDHETAYEYKNKSKLKFVVKFFTSHRWVRLKCSIFYRKVMWIMSFIPDTFYLFYFSKKFKLSDSLIRRLTEEERIGLAINNVNKLCSLIFS